MKRQVGKVTGATSAAGALGAAVSQLVVGLAAMDPELGGPLTVIFTTVFALAGGYLVKPEQREYLDEVIGGLDFEGPDPDADEWFEDDEAEDIEDEVPGDAEVIGHDSTKAGRGKHDLEDAE